jgi:hypothetical protein
MHVAVGNAAFLRLGLRQRLYNHFMMGNLSVDAHVVLAGVDRQTTHFASNLDGGYVSPGAFRGCELFAARLNAALMMDWDALSGADQAFIAGYLTHLTSDDVWRGEGYREQESGYRWWADHPVLGDAIQNAFAELCAEQYPVPSLEVLRPVRVPAAVVALVPGGVLAEAQRRIVDSVCGPVVSFYDVLAGRGVGSLAIRRLREQQARDSIPARAIAATLYGGPERVLAMMIERVEGKLCTIERRRAP